MLEKMFSEILGNFEKIENSHMKIFNFFKISENFRKYFFGLLVLKYTRFGSKRPDLNAASQRIIETPFPV